MNVLAELFRIQADAETVRDSAARLIEHFRSQEQSTAPEDFQAEPQGMFREEPQRQRQEQRRLGTVRPDDIRDPLAKSITDLVTPKQLGMIRALAREAGTDPDEECQMVFKCKAEDLSKRAASSFIDHLKGLERREPARASR